jgi:hypothetical protein
MTSQTLNLCLKSGNSSILLGDPHLEVSQLREQNRGVINSRVHLGLLKTLKVAKGFKTLLGLDWLSDYLNRKILCQIFSNQQKYKYFIFVLWFN